MSKLSPKIYRAFCSEDASLGSYITDSDRTMPYKVSYSEPEEKTVYEPEPNHTNFIWRIIYWYPDYSIGIAVERIYEVFHSLSVDGIPHTCP